MKPINEMSLLEVAEYCESHSRYQLNPEVATRLHELHEQHRWIPVEERLPTEDDVDGGRFLVWIDGIQTDACFAGGVIHIWDDEIFNSGWSEYDRLDFRTAFTHWKRIDKPEGV